MRNNISYTDVMHLRLGKVTDTKSVNQYEKVTEKGRSVSEQEHFFHGQGTFQFKLNNKKNHYSHCVIL